MNLMEREGRRGKRREGEGIARKVGEREEENGIAADQMSQLPSMSWEVMTKSRPLYVVSHVGLRVRSLTVVS